jgi:hypothetical protein
MRAEKSLNGGAQMSYLPLWLMLIVSLVVLVIAGVVSGNK